MVGHFFGRATVKTDHYKISRLTNILRSVILDDISELKVSCNYCNLKLIMHLVKELRGCVEKVWKVPILIQNACLIRCLSSKVQGFFVSSTKKKISSTRFLKSRYFGVLWAKKSIKSALLLLRHGGMHI